MAKAKYYRVLHGQRGQSAKDKLLKYFQGLTDKEPPTGTPKNRPEFKTVYVTPFGFALGGNAKLASTYFADVPDGLLAAIGTSRASDKPAGNEPVLDIPKLKAARVSVKTGATKVGSYKTSKVTGLHYLSYGGHAHSAPFGKSTPTETMETAFLIIRNGLIANGGYTNIHLIKEVF